MGVQGRNVLLFLGNCDSHPEGMSFLRNVKVHQVAAPYCTLNLGTGQCFNQLYKKHLVQKAVCFMD